MERVEYDTNGGCWLWSGATIRGRYGKIGAGGRCKSALAHRASWLVHFGQIPDGAYVLHSCDVPACVNPAHLFLGDHAANMADKMAKGRQACGERINGGRLTAEDVREIRRCPHASQRALSARFQISQSAVSAIKRGRTWKHVSA